MSKGRLLSKVPEVTIYFWVIKVLCTTVGETASDFLNVNLGFGLTGTSIVTGALLLVALLLQFKTKGYVAAVYWTSVVLISVFGTLVTDNLTDAMRVPLETSTIAFSVLLALTFAGWYAKEKTLSIHSIYTRRREAFYWLAILFTFALGTATGDLMAESLGLGYAVTGGIICIVVAVLAIAWRLGLDPILSFWLIYIMTRPLGASLGDYLSQPSKYGGLGFGASVTSAIFISGIAATVTFLSLTKRDLIASAVAEHEPAATRTSVLGQVALVLSLLTTASVLGYYWRQASLLPPEAHHTTPAPPAASAGASHVAAAKTAVSSVAPVHVAPLGDLSSFRTIAVDTLQLVDTGKLSDAQTRVGDLEYEWDNAEAHLKPMNPAKWTELDDAIDAVLRQLRAVHKDAGHCKSSLAALLAIIDADR